jgi:ABC-type nitrate/sulfonate/bicarbonate transport system substrate-binding protein
LTEEFAHDGIEVASLRASSDRKVRESHFDHRVENSFRHGGNAPPIWSRSQGQDVVVIGLTWLPQYQRILAMPGSGIRRVEDLRGKRLALPRRTREQIDFWRASALEGYLQSLAAAGISPDEVTFVDLPIDTPYIGDVSASSTGSLFDARQVAGSSRTEAQALIRGEVDALYHYGAFGPTLQEFLDAQVVVDIGHHSDWRVAINNGTPNVFTVSGKLAREQPRIVARYMAQVLRAANWAKSNRAEASAIIANEVGTMDEWMPDAFDQSMFDDLAPTLRPDLIEALEVRKSFLLEHGFIPRDFSVQDWIDPAPLTLAHEMIAKGDLHSK